MNNNSINVIKHEFESKRATWESKSAHGKLGVNDLRKIDQLIRSLQENLYPSVPSDKENLFPIEAPPPSLELLNKIAKIKEKNFAFQKTKWKEAVQRGAIDSSTFKENPIPFSDKLEILLQANQTLVIRGVGKARGELKMVVKPDALFDREGTLLSQIKDPLYREKLVGKKDMRHYNFEFFDTAREPVIDRELTELKEEKEALEEIQHLLREYYMSLDEEEFSSKLRPEFRKQLNIEHQAILSDSEIEKIGEQCEERAFLFPIREASIREEHAKPTIRGRIAEDGSIGELKSINIHSDRLSGIELMDFWDSFCRFLGPEEIYLEDDAKIEGRGGSYNLRLFRLMTTIDKASWYGDTYAYQSYGNSNEDPKKLAAVFREMPLARALELLKAEGMPRAEETAALLEEQLGKVDTLGDLTRHLGQLVRQGEDFHKELDRILTLLKNFADYQGSDPEILALKAIATELVEARYFRKSYY